MYRKTQRKEENYMFEQKRMTNMSDVINMTQREEKIYELCNAAQIDEMALRLYELIELECGLILRTPNEAPEYMVRRYNKLVKSSYLSLPKQEKLLMEEKK